ncbi:MAG: Rossmann-like and DUF2520 domain-containing protein [Pyrinomonadaceae bacterium]
MNQRKSTQKSRQSVAIIGAGRLGTALAIALSETGYQITDVVTSRSQTAQNAAQLLAGSPQALSEKQLVRLSAANVYIIATPDEQIPTVAKSLSQIHSKAIDSCTALHTSGALSSSVLANLKKKNWHTGSLHPLVSVNEPISGAKALRNAYWCVEGDEEAVNTARQFAKDLKGHTFTVKAENKPLYHAAAVMASGNVVSLFDVALQMLVKCGLTDKEARDAFLPLLESTLRNLRSSNPSEALTGTIARGDVSTLLNHLKALESTDSDTLMLYRLLCRHAVVLAKKKGLSQERLRRILKALS